MRREAYVQREMTNDVFIKILLNGKSYTLKEISSFLNIEKKLVYNQLEALMYKGIIVNIIHNQREYFRIANEKRYIYLRMYKDELIEDIRSLKQTDRAINERESRTCYHHFAGSFGVKLTQSLMENKLIKLEGNVFILTDIGFGKLKSLGIDNQHLKIGLKSKACLDWSERKYHLGGPLGKILCEHFFLNQWAERITDSRAILVTNKGKHALKNIFEHA